MLASSSQDPASTALFDTLWMAASALRLEHTMFKRLGLVVIVRCRVPLFDAA